MLQILISKMTVYNDSVYLETMLLSQKISISILEFYLKYKIIFIFLSPALETYTTVMLSCNYATLFHNN